MGELEKKVETLREEYDVWFYRRRDDREYVYDYIVASDDLREYHPGGLGIDRPSAMWSALGEFLEFMATTYDDERVVERTYGEISDRALDPKAVVNFTPEQYRENGTYTRVREDVPMHWTEGTDLHTGSTTFLPGFSVFLDYNAHHRSYYPNYSFGSGVHTNEPSALRRGILELLEVDAAMIFWLNRIECPRIDLESLSGAVSDLVTNVEAEGLVPNSVALELDLPVPVALSYVTDPSGVPATTFGLGSGTTIEEAVQSSLEECLQIRNTLEMLQAEDGGLPDVRADEFESYLDRAYYYARRPESVTFLDELPEKSRDELEHVEWDTSFSALSALLEQRGIDAYYVDLTADVVRDAGLRQTRVVAPDMAIPNIQPECRFLGTRRLESVPRELGAEPGRNPAPHPIP